MTDTRGPAPGKVPPHVRERLEAKQAKAQTRATKGPAWARPAVIAAVAVAALVIGAAIGIAGRPDPEQGVADQIAESVLPLANQAEAIWRVGVQGAGSISEAALALETQDDPSAIDEHLDAWTAEHQRILDALDTVEVDALAQPLLDGFRAYVRAQFDAAVLLGAAAAHDGSARQELFRAAVREIGRSRTLLSQAREALTALGGPQTPAVEVPNVPGLTRPGQPLPSPFASTDDQAPDATLQTDDETTETDAGDEEPAPAASPS